MKFLNFKDQYQTHFMNNQSVFHCLAQKEVYLLVLVIIEKIFIVKIIIQIIHLELNDTSSLFLKVLNSICLMLVSSDLI